METNTNNMIQKEISLLKIFERVVLVEAKFDMAIEKGEKTRKQFMIIIYLLIFLTLTNIIVHTLGFIL